MKKQIALAMGLAFVSGSAFATKARLEALGEDQYGSQFISDNRNVFLNTATVNYWKDLVTLEWGAVGNTNTSTYEGTDLTALPGVTNPVTDQDLASSPRAEGGFFKSAGNMVYGVYFGSESNTANGLRTLAMGDAVVTEDNNIDLFIGGDAGVQWGASLTYSNSKNNQATADEEQTSIRSRLGIITGDLSVFANINLQNTAENGTAEFDGKSGYQLGATYEWNDIYYMLQHRNFQAEDAQSEEVKVQYNWVGVAKAYSLNDKSNIWISGWYKMEEVDTEFTLAPLGKTKKNYLPLTVAAEVSVKEWLMLRGSVGHVLYGIEEDNAGDEETINKTFVNAGASLVFGDFQVDGLIGTSDSNAGTTTLGENTAGGNGTLRSDALLSRVSFLYRF